MATHWQQSVEPTTDGFFLWNVVPGFVSSQPVTICRTTHTEFCESMRLFEVPPNHPSRLENHGSIRSDGFQGPQWRITVTGRSYVGVIQYRILDGANLTRALTIKADGLVGLGNANDPSAWWYLVPIPPYGWDIVNAGNGYRLNTTTNGTGLQLSPALCGLTHWDILRPGRTKGFHRSHFWIPPFFSQAFCNEPRKYSPVGIMEPIIGNKVVRPANAPPGRKQASNEADALQSALGDITCTLLAVGNDGNATYYQGWTADPTSGAADPVSGLSSQMSLSSPINIERERELFGDTRARAISGTGEYNERWTQLNRPAALQATIRKRIAPVYSNLEWTPPSVIYF